MNNAVIKTIGLTLLLLSTICNGADYDYYVVIGSFDSSNAVETFLATKNLKSNTTAIQAEVNGESRYRAAVGPHANFSEAKVERQALIAQGFSSAWIMQNQKLIKEAAQETVSEPPTPETPLEPTLLASQAPQSPQAPPASKRISQLNRVTIDDIILASPILTTEIEDLADYYLERPIPVTDLIKLKNAINQLFVFNGYINTGVIIPDQKIKEGIPLFLSPCL